LNAWYLSASIWLFSFSRYSLIFLSFSLKLFFDNYDKSTTVLLAKTDNPYAWIAVAYDTYFAKNERVLFDGSFCFSYLNNARFVDDSVSPAILSLRCSDLKQLFSRSYTLNRSVLLSSWSPIPRNTPNNQSSSLLAYLCNQPTENNKYPSYLMYSWYSDQRWLLCWIRMLSWIMAQLSFSRKNSSRYL